MRTPGSGAGQNKNDLRIPHLNVEIEAKNQEQIHLLKDWEQLKRQTLGDNVGILAIRNPRKPEFEEVLCVIELRDLSTLLRKTSGGVPQQTNGGDTRYRSTQAKWAFQQAKDSLTKALKHLDEF
jgi:hypothetical protein